MLGISPPSVLVLCSKEVLPERIGSSKISIKSEQSRDRQKIPLTIIDLHIVRFSMRIGLRDRSCRTPRRTNVKDISVAAGKSNL